VSVVRSAAKWKRKRYAWSGVSWFCWRRFDRSEEKDFYCYAWFCLHALGSPVCSVELTALSEYNEPEPWNTAARQQTRALIVVNNVTFTLISPSLVI